MPTPRSSESFVYDTLNRLTSATVSLSPTPLVKTFAYNAIGNLTAKSDVGTYTYPAAGQPRPHAVTVHQRRHDQHHLHLRCQGQHDRGQRPDRRLLLLQQADLHHPRHHHHRLQPRPRAPALPADRARRHHALSGQRREVHRLRRRHALDQLPDGGRRRRRHARREQRRDRLYPLFPQGPPRLHRGHHRRERRRARALELRRLGQAPPPQRQRRSRRQHHQPDQPRLHRPRGARLRRPRAHERPRLRPAAGQVRHAPTR